MPHETPASYRNIDSELPRPRHSKEVVRKRRGIAKFVTGLLMIGAAATVAVDLHGRETEKQARAEQKTLKEVTTVANSLVVLKEGVALRKVPKLESGQELQVTLLKRVETDEVIRVDRPLIHKNDDGETWLAFSDPDINPAEPRTANADNMVWVNISGLEEESHYDVYAYSNTYQDTYGGQLKSVSNGDQLPSGVAVGSVESVEDFYTKEIERENLKPSNSLSVY